MKKTMAWLLVFCLIAGCVLPVGAKEAEGTETQKTAEQDAGKTQKTAEEDADAVSGNDVKETISPVQEDKDWNDKTPAGAKGGVKVYLMNALPVYEDIALNISLEDASGQVSGATKIKEYLEAGYDYKDIAILTRTNAQLQNFEASLYRHGIPYSIVDGLSFIDRREIKTVLCYLRLICDMNDDEAFEYIYNRPNRWLGQAFIQEVRRLARREKISMYCAMFTVSKANWRYKNAVNNIYATIKTVGDEKYKTVADIIKNLRDYLNLDSYVSKDLCENDDSRVENLNTLERMASDYNDPKKFIAFMTRLSKEKKTNPNSVQLMTIHKSKGLEFPIVFVAGVNQGLLPHKKSENPDEEKRLMYVAMTRAEKILNISSTMQYNGKEVEESEFISHIF